MNRGEAGALPADVVVLLTDLLDRVYQVRCAAEAVTIALYEEAGAIELCDVLIRAARAADLWMSNIPGLAILRRRWHCGNLMHEN